jgi:subtilisin family serine protease
MSDPLAAGVLLKHAPLDPAFGAQAEAVGLEPLFRSIPASGDGLGLEAGAQWSRLAAGPLNPGELWDRCHRLATEGLGLAGAPRVVFAEPDLRQAWSFMPPAAFAAAAARPCGDVKPPDKHTPSLPDPLWFRASDHSSFGPQGAAAQGRGARIAHLDTGFDPDHETLPRRLRRDLQRNFVDADRPRDARDTADGLISNPGHGPATLALVAGPPYGGAPEAEVVPMRVADSVVLFTNSSIARAFDEIHRLTAGGEAPVDVVTMSMGGLASQAWAEAVNALYDAGVFVVTAAGNNYGNLPTRFIVYPARFNRVVAACGVMADHRPYADLPINVMAGNYGPGRKMKTAMAAATPNVPWARIGCPTTVDLDGGGTSSATPQVAAAAARWIARHRAALDAYPEPWMRVEAARRALFEAARTGDASRLGHGELRADEALRIRPAAAADLNKQAKDSAFLGLIRVLTGLGAAGPSDARHQMLELEALQLSQRAGVEAALSDWDRPLDQTPPAELRRLADAIASQPEASEALRAALGADGRTRYAGAGVALSPEPAATDAMERYHLTRALAPEPPTPRRRRLRAYAYDPVLSGRMGQWGMNEAALSIRWEPLEPGPIGEYLEVVDIDPASNSAYAPVDLDDPRLIASDGHAPNESNPQFHQQMAYAVASRTIEHFETALGRVALWAPEFPGEDRSIRGAQFVRRLRIYPHALREENAYYSPQKSALLFGYFDAPPSGAGEVLPGGSVFSCLSHDIVAHETTHALLDGLHRYYREAGSPDAFAFHEAFADIVALFQHFTVTEALKGEIQKTRGDLEDENLLAQLAVQFGQATGRRGALRDAIGAVDKDGVWRRRPPAAGDYEASREAHARGAVLVAAVFDAFLTVYRTRSADLVRLASGGTGILPPGAIPADLATRLAEEAAQVAGEVLQMCIRALDYCPPVDITFGDYLRALITADQDVAGETRREHRVALVAAFRERGIYPPGVRQLSVGSVAWEPPPIPLPSLDEALARLDRSARLQWTLSTDRQRAWANSRRAAVRLFEDLKQRVPEGELAALGLQRTGNVPFEVDGRRGRLDHFEVHSVRPARRVDVDGQARTDLVIEITQGWRPADAPQLVIRGGCTVLFDLETSKVRYLIRKRLGAEGFVGRQLAFRAAVAEADLASNYFGAEPAGREPFALLHRQAVG